MVKLTEEQKAVFTETFLLFDQAQTALLKLDKGLLKSCKYIGAD